MRTVKSPASAVRNIPEKTQYIPNLLKQAEFVIECLKTGKKGKLC
jgi:hypothetical protein